MFEVMKLYEKEGKMYMVLSRLVLKWEDIVLKGEEIKKGDVFVLKGMWINLGVMVFLVMFGYVDVVVVK